MSEALPRLPAPFGQSIDREREVSFSFEGRTYQGYAGDSVASALWANGVRVLSRSFKYKRPRGILSLTGLDGGALMQVGDEPNVPADRLLLAPDLPAITAQNYIGSFEHDRGALAGLFSRFLPVGFYYRAFFRPKGAWKFFERIIRQSGGLGRLRPDSSHPPQTDKQYLFCDVAVVGSGPAGIAAAAAAARRGADVLLIESEPRIGGSLLLGRAEECPQAADLLAEVQASPNVRILTSSLVQGLYADNWLAVESPARLYKVRARHVVAATGSFEQPLIFHNNDLPGVMLASAARRLLWLYGVAPGKRAVVGTVNDEGLATAVDLLDAGVEVELVADLRNAGARGPLHEYLAGRGVRVLMQTAIYEAVSKRAGLSGIFGAPVSAVRVAPFDPSSKAAGGETIACDVVCVSGGFTPAAGLLCHAGARLAYEPARQALAVGLIPPHVSAAGAVRGVRDIGAVISDGLYAGSYSASETGFGDPPQDGPPPRSTGNGPAHPIIEHPDGKEFVDFDEDLTIADIRNAVADGFTHTELLKRYSATGMGPGQGKFSSLATTRIAAQAVHVDPADFGTTTVRAPLTGASFRLLAGQGFSPYRLTPMHARHLELGAQMMIAGAWYRPAYYGTPQEQDEAVRREVHAVRTGVGMIDVSTLGGIELSGPDAAAFLDRVYATPHLKQPVGRVRYALLCEDGGAIVDDGVAYRVAPDRFYLTATTGAVDQTYRKLTLLRLQWQMDVDILNVTSAFAAVNIAGPRSREVLARLVAGIDLSPEAFPYLGARTGMIAGLAARLMRVGFVGELGYEVHVPMPFGGHLWDRVLEAGRSEGILPFGVEAQRVLRLEKGHVIVGQDTDGLTHPYEAGLDWAIPATKKHFIGFPAIEAQRTNGLTRHLVGFRLTDAHAAPPPECCLVIREGEIVGRVTSSTRSDICGGSIGLAYVAPEDRLPGSTIRIKLPSGTFTDAAVVSTPFYDPGNERQHA